jgi:hydrogenase maturation factor
VSKETLPLGTARVGLRIEAESIRILPETAKLCIDFGLNPLGAISSGSLLICLRSLTTIVFGHFRALRWTK